MYIHLQHARSTRQHVCCIWLFPVYSKLQCKPGMLLANGVVALRRLSILHSWH